MKKFFTLLLLIAAIMTSATVKASIGTWNAHMAYTDIKKVEYAGKMVFVLASDGVYSYTPSDQSIQTYDKTKTLSDCDVIDIAWCEKEKKLLVMYANYNIDLLETNGNVTNISDYYNKSMTEDKTISNIYVNGQFAYLSAGFGLLKIDMRNATIAESYNLGVKVNATIVVGNEIFAATQKGLKKGNIDDNLVDKTNWTNVSDKVFAHLNILNGIIIGSNNGELCTVDPDNGTWKAFYTPWFEKIAYCNDRLVYYGRNNTYMVMSTTEKKAIAEKISGVGYSAADNTYWIGRTDGTLAQATVNDKYEIVYGMSGVKPDGPKYNYFGFMKHINGKLYTCGGNGIPERPACVQVYEKSNGWSLFNDEFTATLGYRYNGAFCLDVDPKNGNHVVVGTQTGLYEFENGQLTNKYNMQNSPLQPAVTVPQDQQLNYTSVTALKYDENGCLWLTNSVAKSSSLFDLNNGKWTSHHRSELMSRNKQYSIANMVDIMFDKQRNLMWFSSTDWQKPALICYQPSTDGMKLYDNFVNQDGTSLVVEYLKSVAEDNDGNLWLATASGPLMLAASTIAGGGDHFTQVKVPRNDGTNFADYLLAGVRISTIAIDGAGRKWFGTEDNGVYLISSDNMVQIEHFTAQNSPLLSNSIESIAIDGTTGEVFIGTDKGLCSYMSDASQPSDEMNKDNVYAYPNPVRPDYNGLITVTGLTLDADVKIVTVNGTLVAEGRSNGGTFTWDGNDRKGRRVASGVYMVETATSDGSKGTVCKIAIVN